MKADLIMRLRLHSIIESGIRRRLGKFSPFIQNVFTDKVYTFKNEQNYLDHFWLTNLGLTYTFSSLYDITFRVNNLFDQKYQTQENRWQPGTSFNIQLNFKF